MLAGVSCSYVGALHVSSYECLEQSIITDILKVESSFAQYRGSQTTMADPYERREELHRCHNIRVSFSKYISEHHCGIFNQR